MTGGGGLFACLACFVIIVAKPEQLRAAIAKPQECIKAPSWTLDNENPLENARGNVTLVALLRTSSIFCQQQAFRLETLLQDLYDYGIKDLSFIIVNSKDSPSEEQFNDLQRRLSIPVYQETENQQVWNTMNGGVNDMFIYDRCGRLTYFIPFPLSNLQEAQSVVRAAVLSTYFRSPCGTTCSNNEINELSEVKENQRIVTSPLGTDTGETIHHTNETAVLEDVEDDLSIFDNETFLEKNKTIVDLYDANYYGEFDNSSLTDLFVDNRNSTDQNTTELTSASQDLISAIFHFIWGEGEVKDSNNKKITEEPVANASNEIHFLLDDTNSTDNQSNTESSVSHNITFIPNDHSKKKSCAGIDENICMDWSKTKMMHAQRCCAIAMQTEGDRDRKGCKNFGRKRCKKIHPLLKCCLKTEMPVEESINDDVQGNM